MKERKLTLEEALEAADILRGMLEDEQEKSERLTKRNKELERLLIQNHIRIPDHDIWHSTILPMV